MRFAVKSALAAAVAAASAVGASAQTTGVTGGTGGSTGSTGGIGSSSVPGSSTQPNTGFQAAPQLQLQAATSGDTSGSSLSSSNILGQFYANPQFQGKAGVTGAESPGGFGSPLYQTSGAGSTATGGINRPAGTGTGTTGARTTATGTGTGTTGTTARTGTTGTTGFGSTGTTGTTAGRTGTTGFGGTGTTGFGGATGFGGTGRTGTTGFGTTGSRTGTQQGGGEVIPAPRQIAYTATVSIPAPVMVPLQVQADLQVMLARSAMIANPAGVQVLAQAGGVVVLRGTVRDDDEAKAAEGMIRLTPGVREVRNELKYPTP
jgi:hypothetical protein